MLVKHPRFISFEDYLKLDEESPQGVRLEWFDGTLYIDGAPYDPDWGWERAMDMGGGTLTHNRIISNLSFSLNTQLRARGCDVLIADQYTQYSGPHYVYPDVVVACGPILDGLLLTNPLLVIEVLSKSSIDHDTGRKMAAYMQIASLREYWIVWQTEVRLVRYFRSGDAWITRIYSDSDTVVLSETLDFRITLQDIYRRVFEA